jgi:hypothetical protein
MDMQHEGSVVGQYHLTVSHVTDAAFGTKSNAQTHYTRCSTHINEYLFISASRKQRLM